MAWCNRPCGLGIGSTLSLEDAVKLQRRVDARHPWNLKGDAFGTFGTFGAARTDDCRAVPDWCYPHEHPLRSGTPGKLYHRHDVVDVIVDSMKRLHASVAVGEDSLGLFEYVAKLPRREPTSAFAANERGAARARCDKRAHAGPSTASTASTASGAAPHPFSGWTCVACGNSDLRTCIQQPDALVCPCGNVARVGGACVAAHRDRLGAAETDDATQRGDRVRDAHTDVYDGAPVTARERRAAARANTRVSNVGHVGQTTRFASAVREVERHVAQDRRSEAPSLFQLSQREELKLQRILEALETLFHAFAPVDRAVRRAVRITADTAWTRACSHARVCHPGCGCHLRLQDRAPQVIATAAFESTINRVVDGRDTLHQVDRAHVRELQSRMRRSPTLSAPTARTQMRTAPWIVSELCANPRLAREGCAAPAPAAELLPPPPPPPAPLPPPPHPSYRLTRISSVVSTSSSSSTLSTTSTVLASPSAQSQLHNALTHTFSALSAEMKLATQTSALKAIRSPEFVGALLERARRAFQQQALQGVAFCLLYAVAREMEDLSSDAVHAPPLPLHVGVAHRNGLNLAHAEEEIAALRTLLPRDALCSNNASERKR